MWFLSVDVVYSDWFLIIKILLSLSYTHLGCDGWWERRDRKIEAGLTTSWLVWKESLAFKSNCTVVGFYAVNPVS
jgi:hypothetical protein